MAAVVAASAVERLNWLSIVPLPQNKTKTKRKCRLLCERKCKWYFAYFAATQSSAQTIPSKENSTGYEFRLTSEQPINYKVKAAQKLVQGTQLFVLCVLPTTNCISLAIRRLPYALAANAFASRRLGSAVVARDTITLFAKGVQTSPKTPTRRAIIEPCVGVVLGLSELHRAFFSASIELNRQLLLPKVCEFYMPLLLIWNQDLKFSRRSTVLQ